MLAQETSDERLKYVIEKHVLQGRGNEMSVCTNMEQSLKKVTTFIASYYEYIIKIQQY